jgi:hemolysin activation/secretion protein
MYRSSTERFQLQEALDRAGHVRQTKEPPPSGRRFAAWVAHIVLLGMSLHIALGWCPGAQAQAPFGADQPQRPEPMAPPFPQEQPSPTLPRPELPPVPPTPPGAPKHLPLPRLFVRQIEVVGNTVFSDEDLAEVAAAYVGRIVTAEDLEALRQAFTRLYVNAGYINSGVILPNQTVRDGVVTYRAIEGSLTDTTVEGNRWFRKPYLRSRLALDVEPPLNIRTLEANLQRLSQDERIEQLNAELRPGVRRGESILHVDVKERLPFFVALEFNNYQSPNIGAERGSATLAHQNLTGHGDILQFTFWRSSGLGLQVDTSYRLPLTPRDTSLSLRYQRTDASVVEDVFAPLDIESQSQIFSITLRHPVYRTPRQELALSLTGEHLRSETELLGVPFSFSPGTQNGEAIDTAGRFSVEWFNRTSEQVLAVRSRFSLGFDALGATINADSDVPDGRFFKWLGQFQWGRRLGWWNSQVFFRLDVQLTTEPLLSLEQIAIGGRFSVRGYRENTMVRDNGLIVSLESRIPLVENHRWAEFVRIVPFVDFGRGWNRIVATPEPTNLASIGLGLQWSATWRTVVPLRAYFEVFWGYELLDVETSGGNVQDKGVHLQVVLSAF